MKILNKTEFENLCLIEQKRIYEQNQHPSWLFWLDNDNRLQTCTVLNLLGVDFVKNETWNKILNTQSRKDFQSWLFQKWQEPCLV